MVWCRELRSLQRLLKLERCGAETTEERCYNAGCNADEILSDMQQTVEREMCCAI